MDVSAPGGDRRYWGGGILSTLNAGKTAPGKADYAEYQGTSMAAPHVAGIVALMKAVDPKLTYAQAKKALQSTSQGIECDQSACGSGIVMRHARFSRFVPTVKLRRLPQLRRHARRLKRQHARRLKRTLSVSRPPHRR